MSGGSQHNPNGRQSQLGPGWSPLQLQVANFLARAPQVHLPTDRGVTWHTPTPPPHLYHVPAPSPPDPLQAMKSVGSNSMFRHSATPPELFRHTPTPPDKHLMRHTPSPGDVKNVAPLPQPDLYPHLGPGRDKMVRPEELLTYARMGVDLSLGGRANGSPASPALSVRDAPTINNLIARAQRPAHARVDALLERLAAPAPAPPAHSVIVHPRAQPTPSPPSSNEQNSSFSVWSLSKDSADSCGAPPGSKRKRKPERTVRVGAPPPPAPPDPAPLHLATPHTPPPPLPIIPTIPNLPTHPPIDHSAPTPPSPKPLENGDTPHSKANGPEKPPTPPPARRKTRSGSSETIDDIAAMIASTDRPSEERHAQLQIPAQSEPQVTVDNLKSVLASPEPVKSDTERTEEKPQEPPVEAAAAPRRRSTRTSNSETANVPVESPSEAKPAEPETSGAPTAEPIAASFVEVENQLEKMFAGIEEAPESALEAGDAKNGGKGMAKAKKRRKSAPTKGDRKAARRASRSTTVDEGPRRKIGRKKEAPKGKKAKDGTTKDAYDSGSNASSGRSRGPYIQVRGAAWSPASVCVMNAWSGEEERRREGEEFRTGRRARGLHASTLGLRYDAATPDRTWRCAFCAHGPHAQRLGDLFGPYSAALDCPEYRALDEATRQQYPAACEVWFHEECAVWAPGLVAAGARLWGLSAAVWSTLAPGTTCMWCRRGRATIACGHRGCGARVHRPCAPPAGWALRHDTLTARCPAHKDKDEEGVTS